VEKRGVRKRKRRAGYKEKKKRWPAHRFRKGIYADWGDQHRVKVVKELLTWDLRGFNNWGTDTKGTLSGPDRGSVMGSIGGE